MPERLSAKPSWPALEVGIPGGVFERVGQRDFILLIEVVVDLRVDLLSAIAVYVGNGWSDGKNVFAAAVFAAGPLKAGRIQSVTHFVVIRHWHLAEELRYKSGGIQACSILIPRAVSEPTGRRRRTDLDIRTVRIDRGGIQDGSKHAHIMQRSREWASVELGSV